MEQFNNCKPSLAGFTLIELLVTVALLGILAGGILMVLNIPELLTKTNITKAKKFSAQLENSLVISQVGKWSFEEGSGDTAKDTSGYGNNGNLAGTGTVCGTGGACPTWTSNCDLGFGGCLKFDGGDFITIPNSPNLQLTSAMTLSAWVKGIDDNTERTVLRKNLSYLMRLNSVSETPRFSCFIIIGSNAEPRVSASLDANTWNHYVCTYNASVASNNLKLYKNSVLVDKNSRSGNIDTDTNSFVIGSTAGVCCFWNGSIDEVQIYKEALTLSQIQHLYVQGLIKRAMAFGFR